VKFDLPKVYPITDTRLSGLSHAEQVSLLIAGGARLIQLREKHASALEFYHEAKDALEIARRHNVKLIINDRLDIALALRADGVHLGQTDMPADAARRLVGPEVIIGVSTHNLPQAQQAATLPVNYVAFGPVFTTSTKENPDPVAGLEGLRSVQMSLGSLPLVAIGGITPSNMAEVFAAGANSVALIAALVADPAKITENTRLLIVASPS
jgi:thiamine-phosphate pyrophosphorylase